MNLTALKYIVSLAKEKHFGHAAKACGVTQPTLSIAVKNLEQELGVQLFERSPMNVRVTSSGLPIVRHAHAVMQEVHAIEEIARNSRKPQTGLLRLGLVHHLSPRLMPALVRGMRTLAPEMPVISLEGLSASLSEQLRDGAIDCALMDTPVADSELQSAPLFDEDLFVAVGPKHPWAQLQNIDTYPIVIVGFDEIMNRDHKSVNLKPFEPASLLPIYAQIWACWWDRALHKGSNKAYQDQQRSQSWMHPQSGRCIQ